MRNNTKPWGTIAIIILLLAAIVYSILTIYPDIFPRIPKEIIVLFTTGIVSLIALLIQQSVKLSVDTSLENYKTKFTRLHQNQANAIAELYKLLFHAQRDLQILFGNFIYPEYILQLETTGEGDLGYSTTLKSVATFYLYFNENRIYFRENICEKLDSLIEKFSQVVTLYGQQKQKETGRQYIGNSADEDMKAKASAIVEKDIPKLLEELKQDFQEILGV